MLLFGTPIFVFDEKMQLLQAFEPDEEKRRPPGPGGETLVPFRLMWHGKLGHYTSVSRTSPLHVPCLLGVSVRANHLHAWGVIAGDSENIGAGKWPSEQGGRVYHTQQQGSCSLYDETAVCTKRQRVRGRLRSLLMQ